MCSLLDVTDRMFVSMSPMRSPCRTFALALVRDAAAVCRLLDDQKPTHDEELRLGSSVQALANAAKDLVTASEEV